MTRKRKLDRNEDWTLVNEKKTVQKAPILAINFTGSGRPAKVASIISCLSYSTTRFLDDAAVAVAVVCVTAAAHGEATIEVAALSCSC